MIVAQHHNALVEDLESVHFGLLIGPGCDEVGELRERGEDEAEHLVQGVVHEEQDPCEKGSSDEEEDDEQLGTLRWPQQLEQRLVLGVPTSHVEVLASPEVGVQQIGDSQAHEEVEEQVRC